MALVVREAKAGDVGAINAINRDNLYDYPVEQTRKMFERLSASGKDKILVAEKDGAVVGYVHACDYDTLCGPHMTNLIGLVVLSAYRRQGVGTALMRAIEQWAAIGGIARIRMTVGESQTGAHEFYRANGYYGVKREINFKKKPVLRPRKHAE